jgi:hypothetical protein
METESRAHKRVIQRETRGLASEIQEVMNCQMGAVESATGASSQCSVMDVIHDPSIPRWVIDEALS